MANGGDLMSGSTGLDGLHCRLQSRRREVIKAAGALTLAGLLGSRPEQALADAGPPPETTRLRLLAVPAICLAPQYVAESLLREEGFTDIEYTKLDLTTSVGQGPIASGSADLSLDSAGDIVSDIDHGAPVVTLGGVHLGCYELFGNERIRAIRDLKGKSVAIE